MDTLFNLKTKNVLLLKKLFESLKEIMIETNLEMSDEWIKISHINSENSICCFLELPAETLNEDGSEYSCQYPASKSLIVGVNLLHITKIFKCIASDSLLYIQTRASDKNILHLIAHNSKKTEISKYSMNYIEIDGSRMSIPSVLFDTILLIDAKFFQKIIKEINAIKAKSVDIRFCGNQLIFTGMGTYVSRETIVESSEAKGNLLDIVQKRDDGYVSQGEYNIKDLVSISKFSSLAEKITIKMKTDVPLIIELEIPTLGKLMLLIATKKVCD